VASATVKNSSHQTLPVNFLAISRALPESYSSSSKTNKIRAKRAKWQENFTGSVWWLLFFTVALATRLLNAPYAFENGKPRITPVDELYHWKRMVYSACHFPHALEFDRDRGIGGEFCPWPPLYDVASGDWRGCLSEAQTRVSVPHRSRLRPAPVPLGRVNVAQTLLSVRNEVLNESSGSRRFSSPSS